jgi:hypothetical protein
VTVPQRERVSNMGELYDILKASGLRGGAGGGGGFTPTQEQLDAMNSGIDSEKVAQIATNETNILSNLNADLQVRKNIDNNIFYSDLYKFETGYYYYNGNKNVNADWGTTSYIPVKSSTRYNMVASPPTSLFVNFYSESKTYISGDIAPEYFTTPSNCKYVLLSMPRNRIDGFRLAENKYIRYVPKVIECGSGKEYTRLRDAVKEAAQYGDTVVVYPGVYDLTNEFETELSTTLTAQTGIELKNGVHIVCMAGAYITANFDGTSDSIYDYFSPFYTTGSFTLENAHIVASNCRYCVHDEMSGAGTYQTKYINCHMEFTNTRQNAKYVQAVGGGLGLHATILFEGGYYKSSTSYGNPNYGTYGTAENYQQPISYHNGNAGGCDSKITIKNVYLADRGYIRIGSYGSSTSISPVEISNCSFGLPIMDMYETEQSTNHNMGVTAYNNTSRNAEVPFDFSRVIDIYTNSDE